jgi:hypothetical protein
LFWTCAKIYTLKIISSESKRIAQLVGFKPIIPGHRLPVVKVSPEQYSTKEAIRRTLASRPNVRTLVLCHGRSYSKKSYIKSDVFYLDINPVARPDFLGDIRDTDFMFRFPRGYFKTVYLTYVPPPFPFTHKNMPIYLSCHYILQRNGELRSRYIHFMLAKKPKYNAQKVKEEIFKKGPSYYNKKQIVQGQIIMTKL